MKDTLIINLYGGPGSGKSTGAAYLFAKLKMAGVDAEYVTEYAKDKENGLYPVFVDAKLAKELLARYSKITIF